MDMSPDTDMHPTDGTAIIIGLTGITGIFILIIPITDMAIPGTDQPGLATIPTGIHRTSDITRITPPIIQPILPEHGKERLLPVS